MPIHIHVTYCLLLIAYHILPTHDSATVWLLLLSAVYWAPRLLSQPLARPPPGAETVDGVPSRQLKAEHCRQLKSSNSQTVALSCVGISNKQYIHVYE